MYSNKRESNVEMNEVQKHKKSLQIFLVRATSWQSTNSGDIYANAKVTLATDDGEGEELRIYSERPRQE